MELLPVQGRRKAADLAFSVEGGRRREKLAVGGSLPMGESTRWREKGKGAREQGEGGGGYPPTERGERRQPLPVAKDSRSLGAGLQREVGGDHPKVTGGRVGLLCPATQPWRRTREA